MERAAERISKYTDIIRKYPRHRYSINKYIEEYGEGDTAEMLYLHVYAPVMIAYTNWVLCEASRKGISRLYFLARDGMPMHRVAEVMARSRNLGMDLRYLMTSRFALRRAEYHMLGADAADRVCSDGIKVTFNKIMARAALAADEADEIASEVGYADRRQEIISKHELQELKAALRGSVKFLGYMSAHSEQAYEATIGYFKDQGLLDDIRYALVDSGWIGTIQESIGHICSRDDISGYYFGIYSLPKNADKEKYHSYYFGADNHIRRKVMFSNNLFESIYSAPDGMTLGYERAGHGNNASILDEHKGASNYTYLQSPNPNPNADLIKKELVILERYAECYENARSEYPEDIDETCMMQELLELAMAEPSIEEAEIFGSRLFSDDMLDADLQQVADILTQKQIRQHFALNSIAAKLGLSNASSVQTAWIEGSIVRAGKNVNHNLNAVRRRKYIGLVLTKLKH